MPVPIILSGGAGTRLWPISRESHQFKKHAPD
ncbi:MAG: sugar phosphate nucleotidyltransferase [Sulfuricella sp.]